MPTTQSSLRISHADLDPVDVAERLGVPADRAYRRGEPTGLGGLGRVGLWLREARASREDDLAVHLRDLVDFVSPRESVVAGLKASGYEIDVFVGLFADGETLAFEVSADSMAILGRTGITLGVDAYGDCGEGEGEPQAESAPTVFEVGLRVHAEAGAGGELLQQLQLGGDSHPMADLWRWTGLAAGSDLAVGLGRASDFVSAHSADLARLRALGGAPVIWVRAHAADVSAVLWFDPPDLETLGRSGLPVEVEVGFCHAPGRDHGPTPT